MPFINHSFIRDIKTHWWIWSQTGAQQLAHRKALKLSHPALVPLQFLVIIRFTDVSLQHQNDSPDLHLDPTAPTNESGLRPAVTASLPSSLNHPNTCDASHSWCVSFFIPYSIKTTKCSCFSSQIKSVHRCSCFLVEPVSLVSG